MELPWQRFVMFTSVVVIVLLVASNVLLLQIVLDDDKQPAVAKQPAQAALPELPAPSKSGTSKALLKELDKTQRKFADPLTQAMLQLDSVSSSAATLDQLPVLLQQMVNSTAQLGEVAPKLQDIDKRMRSLNRRITQLSAFAIGLGPVVVDLELTLQAMRDDIAKIRACSEKPDTCK